MLNVPLAAIKGRRCFPEFRQSQCDFDVLKSVSAIAFEQGVSVIAFIVHDFVSISDQCPSG